MFNSNLPESDLLKSLLEPLLDDFQYWFGQSQRFLETQDISFLSADEQADLLARVLTAQQEVSTTKLLFDATGGQVGVEAAILAPWHQLVTECWQIAARVRLEKSTEKGM